MIKMSEKDYFRLDAFRKHIEHKIDSLDEDVAETKAQITELENKLNPKNDDLMIMLYSKEMYEKELKRIEDLIQKECKK